MIAPLVFYFYYIVVSAVNLTTYTELGPFGTIAACHADQQFYLAEGSLAISECYQR